jgi:hypothetical protein
MSHPTAPQPKRFAFADTPTLVGREFIGPWLSVDDQHEEVLRRIGALGLLEASIGRLRGGGSLT